MTGFHWCRSYIVYLPPVENEEKIKYNIVNYIRKNSYTSSKILDEEIKKAIKVLPEHIKQLLKDTKFYIANKYSYYDRNKDEIYLPPPPAHHTPTHDHAIVTDAPTQPAPQERGQAKETQLDILHNSTYIEIQKKGLNVQQMYTDNMKGYAKENEFWLDGNKFISEYQRRVYEQDIDGNYKLDYSNYTFNTKTLGEYFSEGFRCYFENNSLLRKNDINLYNYIKEILK